MYLNLQLGNFHVILGKLAEQAAKQKPLNDRFFASFKDATSDSEPEEFFLDDETKLRYQTTR